MVHLGGHEQGDSGLGARGSAKTAAGGPRPGRAAVPLIAALTLFAIGLAPTPAAAQAAIGFHGGGAVDPEQVFGGVFFQTGDLGRGIRLRPGIDGGAGDGLRVATIGVDFVYGYPLNAGWTLVAGGGPALVITRIPDLDVRDTGVGFHSLVGFGHDNGFFAEVRLGSGSAQQLKVGVGWAITLN